MEGVARKGHCQRQWMKAAVIWVSIWDSRVILDRGQRKGEVWKHVFTWPLWCKVKTPKYHLESAKWCAFQMPVVPLVLGQEGNELLLPFECEMFTVGSQSPAAVEPFHGGGAAHREGSPGVAFLKVTACPCFSVFWPHSIQSTHSKLPE